MPTAIAITHVAFEDLGSLEDELLQGGYRIAEVDACTANFTSDQLRDADLVVVLGGPIGAYETTAYPFLQGEMDFLGARLARDAPTLGICLGAQLMAAARGARVYPGQGGKELGWGPLRAGRDAGNCPAMLKLLQPDLSVLHWHGDTFDLPTGAQHLAATDVYENQAWSLGDRILALQFHPEVIIPDLERWYVGHAAELATANIDVRKLREESARRAPQLQRAAQQFWKQWLESALA